MSDLVQMISKHYEAVSILRLMIFFLKDVCYQIQEISRNECQSTDKNRNY